MHLDILLICRRDALGHGELLTYFSPDWGTYLLNFQPRRTDDRGSQRSQNSIKKVAKILEIETRFITIKPLLGKYAVSVKPHAKYRDPIIYVFEFCSVILADAAIPPDRSISPDDPRPFRKWLSLATMRRDKTAFSVNGDVIRAMHELFDYDLGRLPVSLPSL
jgi:hypothetical protein